MASNEEIVDLIVRAEDLSSEKLKTAAKALEKLGSEADKAEKELNQLKLNEKNLSRFIELNDNIKKLSAETQNLRVENQRYVKSVKSSGEETAKQTLQIIKNKDKLKEQQSILTRSKKEYRELSSTLKEAGVGIRYFNVSLDKNKTAIKESERNLSSINKQYAKQTGFLKKATEAEEKSQAAKRESIALDEKQAHAMNELFDAQKEAYSINEQLIASAKEKAIADKASADAAAKKLVEDAKLLNLNKRIKESKNEQIALQKKKEIEDKKEIARQKKLNKIHAQAIIENNKLIRKKKEKAAIDEKERIELEKSQLATKKYSEALKKLNKSYAIGNISKKKFVKEERKLRESLKLTEKQAKETASALSKSTGLKGRIKSTDALTKVTRRLAQAYTVVIAAQKAAAVVGDSVKGYGELETAVTKVQKTTTLAKEQLEFMTSELQRMSEDVTPTATKELLKYAEVAGQLGAEGVDDILNIAEAADSLGVSTNLAGEEAVTLLTRMLQMTGEGIPAIHNLSSSLVQLGNNFAANEAEIAQMTKEVITGTRAINLGAGASAGFAAVLKELGQTGERSRSSMFRLSEAIAKAAVEGGDSLENLSSITKLTGDEIKESLGKNSEKVLLAFVDGLSRVKSEGGLVSDALEKFNITSIESKSVFGALASNSQRLAEGVKSSTQAFIDGDKHLLEAAKAYATQDATLERLNNKFITLKAVAGEAFSDDVQSSATSLGDIMENNKEIVIELANQTSELGSEIIQTFQSLERFAEELGLLDFGKTNFSILKIFVNDLQVGIDVLSASILQLKIYWAEWTGAAGDEIDELRRRQDEAFKSMEGNIKDIQNAEEDWAGTSSATFRDLKRAATEHADVLHLLTQAERDQLEEALKNKEITKEGTALQSKLTAAITKAIRVNEGLLEVKKKKLESEKKSIENNKELKEITNVLSTETGNLSDVYSHYNKQLEEGIITETRHKEILKLIDKASKDTLKTLTPLKKSYSEISDVQVKMVGSNKDLVLSIISQKKELVDLKKILDNNAVSTIAYQKAVIKTAKVQRQLTLDTKKLESIRTLEKKTLRELKQLQSEHNKEVARVQKLYENNIISVEQYDIAMEELAFKTEFFNERLGEGTQKLFFYQEALDIVTESLGDGNEQLQERIRLMRESLGLDEKSGDNTKGIKHDSEEVAQAVSLWAIAQNRLNEELDFTDLTINELTDKSKELNKEWKLVRATAGGWWDDLHRLNNQAVRREQQTIKETIAIKKLEERVSSGTLTMKELDKAATRAQYSFKSLGDEQLAPLRDAIQAAKEEFQDLSATIDDSLSSVEDRLDAALGNQEAIVKRRFQKEMDDLLSLLDRAKQSGDNKLIQRVNEAIRELKQAQNLEFKDQFGKKSNTSTTSNNQDQNNQQGFGSGNREVTVTLNLNGAATSFDFASQADADAFVSAMEGLGEVNSQGIG